MASLNHNASADSQSDAMPSSWTVWGLEWVRGKKFRDLDREIIDDLVKQIAGEALTTGVTKGVSAAFGPLALLVFVPVKLKMMYKQASERAKAKLERLKVHGLLSGIKARGHIVNDEDKPVIDEILGEEIVNNSAAAVDSAIAEPARALEATIDLLKDLEEQAQNMLEEMNAEREAGILTPEKAEDELAAFAQVQREIADEMPRTESHRVKGTPTPISNGALSDTAHLVHKTLNVVEPGVEADSMETVPEDFLHAGFSMTKIRGPADTEFPIGKSVGALFPEKERPWKIGQSQIFGVVPQSIWLLANGDYQIQDKDGSDYILSKSEPSIETSPEQADLQRAFSGMVEKMSSLAGRSLKAKSDHDQYSTHDELPRVQLDGKSIELVRILGGSKQSQYPLRTDTLRVYENHVKGIDYEVQRTKNNADSLEAITFIDGRRRREDKQNEQENMRRALYELGEINQELDEELAVKAGEISLLPGHTAHEARVRRSRERNKNSPKMAARVLVNEAVAAVDASMLTTIPSPKNHVGFNQTVINGTVNLGSKQIIFDNVLVNYHHKWAGDKGSIRILENGKEISIKNDGKTLSFSGIETGNTTQSALDEYSGEIFDASELLVRTTTERNLHWISRHVTKPATVDDGEVLTLVAKMTALNKDKKQGSAHSEEGDCIREAGQILDALSSDPAKHATLIQKHLVKLAIELQKLCHNIHWFNELGFLYQMQIIQSIDRLRTSTEDPMLTQLLYETRIAAGANAANSLREKAERDREYSRLPDSPVDKNLPYYRSLLYVLDATGMKTRARSDINFSLSKGSGGLRDGGGNLDTGFLDRVIPEKYIGA